MVSAAERQRPTRAWGAILPLPRLWAQLLQAQRLAPLHGANHAWSREGHREGLGRREGQPPPWQQDPDAYAAGVAVGRRPPAQQLTQRRRGGHGRGRGHG